MTNIKILGGGMIRDDIDNQSISSLWLGHVKGLKPLLVNKDLAMGSRRAEMSFTGITRTLEIMISRQFITPIKRRRITYVPKKGPL